MPSMVRANSGTTNPPRPSAAKITSSCGRGQGQRVHRGRRPLHLDAVEPADLLGHPGGGHRQRDPAAAPLGRDQVEHDQQGPVVADQLALLVHERDPLAHRVEPDAERGPGRGHHARPAAAGPARCCAAVSVGETSSSRLLTVSTSTPSRAEQAGQHQRRGAARAVDHDLQPGLADAGHVDAAQQLVGVGLDHPGREAAARRSRRGRPAGTPAGRTPAPACAGAAWDRSAPRSSRKMMSTDCGSPGVVRSAMPPLHCSRAVSNRATGSGCGLQVDAR